MPAANRRDLFLQVSADVSPLKQAMQAGKGALLQFGGDVDAQLAAIDKSFAGFGQSAAMLTQSGFNKAFSAIRAQAASLNQGGGISLNVAGAEAAARAAEQQAAYLMELSQAAQRAAVALGQTDSTEALLAVSSRAAAREAEQYAIALRAQATALGRVQEELGPTAVAEEELAGGHGRMSASGMIAEHVIRSFSDSMAAGQSPVRAMTMEMGRVTEALTIWGSMAEQSGTLTGRLAGFFGQYGLALSLASTALTIFLPQIAEQDAALQAAKVGSDGLAEAQGVLGKMFDLTSGRLEHQNSLLRLNAELTSLNLRSEAEKQRDSSSNTLSRAGHASFGASLEGFVTGDPADFLAALKKGSPQADLVARLGAGAVTPEAALKEASKLDYSGLKISKQQLEQAIIDASSADLKDKTADAIDKSLSSNTLDLSLRQVGRTRKPRTPKLGSSQDYEEAAARAKLATATDAVSQAEAQLELIRARRAALTPREYEAELTQAEQLVDLAKGIKELMDSIASRAEAGSRAFSTWSGTDFSDFMHQAQQQRHGSQEAANDNFQKRPTAPMDQYRDQLRDDVGDMNKAMSGLQADAFKHLGDDLAGLIDGSKSAKQAFKDFASSVLSDIARIAAEKLILSALGLGDKAGGGTSVLSKLFGGGKAVGGPVDSSKFYLVGENGPELFAPGRSGSIIPNHQLGGPLRYPTVSPGSLAAASAPKFTVEAVPNPYFDVRVRQVSSGLVQQAAPQTAAAGAALAGDNAAKARRRSLLS